MKSLCFSFLDDGDYDLVLGCLAQDRRNHHKLTYIILERPPVGYSFLKTAVIRNEDGLLDAYMQLPNLDIVEKRRLLFTPRVAETEDSITVT